MHPHKYAIPQLSEQLSLSLLQQIDSRPYQQLTFQSLLFDFFFVWLVFLSVFRFLFFIMTPQHLAFAPSVSVFPLLPPKDTAVSGIRPGCGLILTEQWAMQAFFFPPTVGSRVEYLPGDVFCWAPFTHNTDCKWCSGLQSSWPRRRPDTSLSQEEPQETGQTPVPSVAIRRILWLAVSR